MILWLHLKPQACRRIFWQVIWIIKWSDQRTLLPWIFYFYFRVCGPYSTVWHLQVYLWPFTKINIGTFSAEDASRLASPFFIWCLCVCSKRQRHTQLSSAWADSHSTLKCSLNHINAPNIYLDSVLLLEKISSLMYNESRIRQIFRFGSTKYPVAANIHCPNTGKSPINYPVIS